MIKKFTYKNIDGKIRTYEVADGDIVKSLPAPERRDLFAEGYSMVSFRQSSLHDNMDGGEFSDVFGYEIEAAKSVGIEEPFLVRATD